MMADCRKPNWPELPIDVFELILSKLSLRYILRLKAISRSFYKAVDYVLQTSSSSFTCLAEPPWLYLGIDGHGFRFQSLHQEFKFYHLNQNNMAQEFRDHFCLGSSRGWLLLLSKTLDFTLLNPLSAIQLPLPPGTTFPDFILDIDCLYYRGRFSTFNVLSLQPSLLVTIMYNVKRFNAGPYSIAFCTTDADGKWTKLDERKWYLNNCCHHDQLYALRQDISTVEVWDFSTSFPIKKMEIRADHALGERINYHQAWPQPCYIAKTAEDLLLISSLFRKICVFKLDYNSDGSYRWIETESIGKGELYLNRDQSLLTSTADDASECNRNSIYFTNLLNSGKGAFGLFAYSLRKKKEEKVQDLVFWMPYGSILFDPNLSFFLRL